LRCRGLMLDRVNRAVLVVLLLTTCATRLHAHAVEPPDVTMEVTQCLRLISVATSKRHTARGSGGARFSFGAQPQEGRVQ
jgi:hypothetical protein